MFDKNVHGENNSSYKQTKTISFSVLQVIINHLMHNITITTYTIHHLSVPSATHHLITYQSHHLSVLISTLAIYFARTGMNQFYNLSKKQSDASTLFESHRDEISSDLISDQHKARFQIQ